MRPALWSCYCRGSRAQAQSPYDQVVGDWGDPGTPGWKPLVNRLLLRQLLVVLVSTAAALVLGWMTACSVLLGGLVSTASNYFFARKVLAGRDDVPAGTLIVSFYWAEAIKIVMAAVLLALAIVVVEQLNALALIAGFLVAHIAASLILGTERD